MAGIVLDKIVTDSLILYVDAANSRCYTSPSTTLKELTDIGTGALVAGTGYSSSNLGAWTFDGTDDYIDLGTRLPSLGLTYPMSIDAWVNPTNIVDSGARGIFTGAANPTNTVYVGFNLLISYPTYQIFTIIGDETGNGSTNRRSLTSTNSITPGVWNHVVATVVSGPTFEIYINGTLSSGTTTGTGGALSWGTNATAQMGQGPGYPNKFNGSIASAKFYNKQLSASEVLQNYNASKKRFGL
jgi:hypothetical protein